MANGSRFSDRGQVHKGLHPVSRVVELDLIAGRRAIVVVTGKAGLITQQIGECDAVLARIRIRDRGVAEARQNRLVSFQQSAIYRGAGEQ